MIDSVIVWKWKKPGYRSVFTAAHVNTMREMVARHYPSPHRFICITDDPKGLADGVEFVRLWRDFEHMSNPSYIGGPNCYARLKAFSKEFEAVAGERFVSIDLDCVITGDLRPLWDRPDDFVMYGAPTSTGIILNGSLWLMRAGTRSKVWETFDRRTSGARAHNSGCRGSDQGWIQYCLGNNGPSWTTRDGVYSYKFDLLRRHGGALPPDARVVVFHGKPDPWDAAALSRSPWIAEHYR